MQTLTRLVYGVVGTANFLLLFTGAVTYVVAVICVLIMPALAVLALSLWIWG